ncbi:two-component system sensor histidine kinase NtrB [Halovenus sp. HT40]|uniref:two-component system sensor histidine kinase NtrB n=1 Tax=Halovenus sp. HT40 TaxID=3126691 RepID=UPI00300F37A0
MTDVATVLLVDSRDTVADRLREEFQDSPVRIRVESDLDQARTELAAAAIDCLLVNLESFETADSRTFVTDAGRIAASCPVVLLTSVGADAIEDDLLEQTSTLVERTDDPESWAFLAEKIRGTLRTVPDGRDDEMYRMLVESARDGLYRLDANGNLVYANESWSQMLGYERSEMIGSHASQAMAEGELERGQQLIQQILEDDQRESDIVDLEMTTKDGEQITVAVRFVVLTTDDGAYDGVMGVARDVTERRANERKLERKNKRLDEFASVVSHDLRNPLNVAAGRLELLDEQYDSEHIEPIDRALTRMDDLIETLLTLAREGETVTDLETVDLGALSQHCWQNVATDEATLHTRIDGPIRADRSRLKQLLENLIRNAVEHGGADVTITIGDLDDGFYVEDDGLGIPQADRSEVFDAGYSTAAEGTGFGLNIVKQVAEAHGWEICVTAGSDGGARFEISGVTSAE